MGGLSVIRFDSPSEILGVQEMPDGSVCATATVARCGIYEYKRADGSVIRELVAPEDLFDPRSLKTLGNVAFTLNPPTGHPPEMIDPDNFQKYSKGHVHSVIETRDSDDPEDFGYVQVRLSAKARDAVEAVKKGGLKTSPGYGLPEYDPTPGVREPWGAYDARQGYREYNHVAGTYHPRGGDGMMVHVDSADVACEFRSDPDWVEDEGLWVKAKRAAKEQGRDEDWEYVTEIYKKMGGQIGGHNDSEGDLVDKTIVRLDSVDKSIEVTPLIAEYITQEMQVRADAQKSLEDTYEEMKSKHDEKEEELASLRKDMEKLKGELDGEKARADGEKVRADSAESKLSDHAELKRLVAPRFKLEGVAKRYLAEDRHDSIAGLDDASLKREVISVLLPSVKVEGRTDTYVDALYETALSVRTSRTDSSVPDGDGDAKRPPEVAPQRSDAEIAGERYKREYAEATGS